MKPHREIATIKYWRQIMSARRVFIVVVIASLVVGSVQIAFAHKGTGSGGRYKQTRPSNDWSINAYFSKTFPTGAARTRIINGANAWNKLNRKHAIVVHRKTQDDGTACPTQGGAPVGVIVWGPIDGPGGTPHANILAENSNCTIGGRLSSFRQTYDRQDSWYRGTGNAPASSADMWSVAAHEMGHASGWRGSHYKAADAACDKNSNRYHTMCATYYPGTERQRTLEQHDIHTFKNVYPVR